jgi:hypothetical protein
MNAVFTRILRQGAKESSRLLRFKYTISLGAFHMSFALDSAPALSHFVLASSSSKITSISLLRRHPAATIDLTWILGIYISYKLRACLLFLCKDFVLRGNNYLIWPPCWC